MSGTAAILPPTNPFSATNHPPERAQLRGVCSINAGSDEACEAISIALDRMSVICVAPASFSDPIVFSFPEFGLVEGTVASTFPGGFEARFETATDSKLALYLACLTDLSRGDPDESPPSILPIKRIVTLGAAGEPERMARITDLTRSSVSLTTNKDLAPDQPVTVGARPGHVARVFAGGAEIAFDEAIAEHDFDPLIELNAQPCISPAPSTLTEDRRLWSRG